MMQHQFNQQRSLPSTPIPSFDPYTCHIPPAGRTSEQVTVEKRGYTAVLLDHAATFPIGVSQELAKVAVEVMQECHFNQFRCGRNPSHYTSHTTAVALKASELADSHEIVLPLFVTDSSEKIWPAALAFVLAAFHDCIEDYERNFERGLQGAFHGRCPISPLEGGASAEMIILARITPIIGANAAAKLIEAIKILSITNEDDFPSLDYVQGITSNPYTLVVKQADYLHNLRTSPDFSPTYPLFVVPGCYSPLFIGTAVEQQYGELLLPCLASFDPGELVPWSDELMQRGIRTAENVGELLVKYQPNAFGEIRGFYDKFAAELNEGRYDNALDSYELSREPILKKIDVLLAIVTPPLQYSDTILLPKTDQF